ncbi:hypothetical protein NDU88_010490 [Pleurodeles waltl]|uniref:Uncharacterized protein n=1 Tax=Pleurodeles waltl TaxID=8319 RepID=A0AAV7Q243_PLEWA|nr:hypothetical protein NDU88_010490 [Pleurodeles waltl]
MSGGPRRHWEPGVAWCDPTARGRFVIRVPGRQQRGAPGRLWFGAAPGPGGAIRFLGEETGAAVTLQAERLPEEAL